MLWRSTARGGGFSQGAGLRPGSQSGATYLLVLEQQQLAVLDLEGPLLEAGSLQQLGRLLTTPEQPHLDDVTLVGWTHTQVDRWTGGQAGRRSDSQ